MASSEAHVKRTSTAPAIYLRTSYTSVRSQGWEERLSQQQNSEAHSLVAIEDLDRNRARSVWYWGRQPLHAKATNRIIVFNNS